MIFFWSNLLIKSDVKKNTSEKYLSPYLGQPIFGSECFVITKLKQDQIEP